MVAFYETDDDRIEVIRTVVENGRHKTIFEQYDKLTKGYVTCKISTRVEIHPGLKSTLS